MQKTILKQYRTYFLMKFFIKQQNILKKKIVEYNTIPTKNFINDKSNLIKKTFVTAINKQLSLYGSFSYFSGKTSISNLKLLTSSNFLKFLVEKNSLKWNLKLQLVQIDGSEVKASNNKIHHFSTTKLRKKKKKRYVWANRNNNNRSTTRF